jgi:hypothetical protein
MNLSTIESEVSECEFGDVRLKRRLESIVTQFSHHPTLNTPGAMKTKLELDNCYSFFDHPEVTPQKILSTHRNRTIERILSQKVSLLVQDTSEAELTRPNQQVVGAGPLSCQSRQGVYLHPLIAYTPEKLNLGLVWLHAWARQSIDTERTAKQKSKHLETIPIEAKESYRWLEGQREARQVAELCPDTQCVLVCDSEADIYEVFSEPRDTSHARSLELLIRGCHDRATDEVGKHLLAKVRETEVLHGLTIEVSGRKSKVEIDTSARGKSRLARTAQVDVRACPVTLNPPDRFDRQLPAITLNVVLIEESAPPPGEVPIRWILLTTLPIGDLEQILTIVNYYVCRWTIENYFKILKSGCRIEERLYETLDRELNAIAVYMIVAWRIQLFCHLGRACPEMDCSVLFEESEWKAVYIIATRKQPPDQPPTTNEIIRLIATLGGYLPRKNNEPGYQTLWIGMQRMRDLAHAYDVFGPGTKFDSTT